jgi:type IV pilus assembly protein PilQ
MFRLQGNIYIIGGNKVEDLKEFRVIQLQNRTINKILEVFPEGLKAGVELKEFPDLNSILVGGPSSRIAEVEQFVRKIDKIVPVILIEVLIVNMTKTFTVSTGIESGVGTQPTETKIKMLPDINVQLGSESINNLLNSFNGYGVVNIGHVTPNFYLNLKALENQGILKVSSTPKLSTLNGNEANLTIGTTEYYKEQRSDLYGAQNPQLTTTETYKPVTAELKVVIKPIVAGDDQITMEIEVNQSSFTTRISDYAPPGAVSRQFKSIIRVKNQEMVLLGGLEEKKLDESSTGVPWLSRIPVIKWFFSSRRKETGSSRLNVFIKPTIIN